MTTTTFRPEVMRVTRLDDEGNPTGEPLTIRMNQRQEQPMAQAIDPKNPASLTDAEAAALATRPSRALVIDLLQAVRDERAHCEVAQRAREDVLMDLRTSEDRRAAVKAELDTFDPEARLVADMQAAVDAYHQRVREADERAAQAQRGRGGMMGDTYGMAVGQITATQPYRPALDSPLGRAMLQLAARHSVAIEATVVYPDAGPEQQLVSVPRHVADQLQQMPWEAWR